MKKIMIILAMIVTVATSAFAGEEKIDQKVVEAFKKEFTGASEESWLVKKNVYQVSFTYNGRKISAFYDKKGYLLGVTRYILSTDLPYFLQKELKEYYEEYWVTGLFELSNEEGTSYYVTLQNADSKIILSSKEQNSWEFFNEYKNQ
ncbi:MAG: hypothetical protein EPN92_06610 [Chitinophagaceae bacterium]|nr:MAG: hypothetical protein EPN92_06610 [Chitinophagaceae bacterium]